MKSLTYKAVFVFIWLFFFYELLFNPQVRAPLFVFCQEYKLFAPLFLVSPQVLLAFFALPCSPLSVLAGILWGFYWGVLFSTIATLVASTYAYFLGRDVLKGWAERKITSQRLARIIWLISKYKWKASVMAHANPVFPGSSLGYAFGLSKISFKAFFFGLFLGTIPLQILTVMVGSSASEFSISFKLNVMLGVSGSVFLIIAYYIVSKRLVGRWWPNK